MTSRKTTKSVKKVSLATAMKNFKNLSENNKELFVKGNLKEIKKLVEYVEVKSSAEFQEIQEKNKDVNLLFNGVLDKMHFDDMEWIRVLANILSHRGECNRYISLNSVKGEIELNLSIDSDSGVFFGLNVKDNEDMKDILVDMLEFIMNLSVTSFKILTKKISPGKKYDVNSLKTILA